VPELVLPRLAAAASVRAAARAHGDDGLEAYTTAVAGLADEELPGYVEALLADAREHAPRREGWVPSTHLWWVEGTTFLGRVHVRHRLTPWLRELGGHVGYHVVPEHRRRGHATAMLAAALPVVAQLGIECALVACDVENTASRRVVERAGGLFHDQRGGRLRYWLPTG
jgi:predicted acetyltransferase